MPFIGDLSCSYRNMKKKNNNDRGKNFLVNPEPAFAESLGNGPERLVSQGLLYYATISARLTLTSIARLCLLIVFLKTGNPAGKWPRKLSRRGANLLSRSFSAGGPFLLLAGRRGKVGAALYALNTMKKYS